MNETPPNKPGTLVRPMRDGWRQSELGAFAERIRWLDEARASASYEYAGKFSSGQRFGLDSATVAAIERHEIESRNVAVQWVRDRIPGTGSVRVVFGPKHVFVAGTPFFLDHWPDLFGPGRDDVLILANDDDDWVLLYSHEDELEYGRRCGPSTERNL
jgi:hypothetical protein